MQQLRVREARCGEAVPRHSDRSEHKDVARHFQERPRRGRTIEEQLRERSGIDRGRVRAGLLVATQSDGVRKPAKDDGDGGVVALDLGRECGKIPRGYLTLRERTFVDCYDDNAMRRSAHGPDGVMPTESTLGPHRSAKSPPRNSRQSVNHRRGLTRKRCAPDAV